MSLAVFPPGFLWGAATAAHQVEGNNDNNDWWDWEAQPGRIHDGSRSGAAAGWWAGRAEEDLALAAELGQNAHRMGVEWSRLEPEPGVWDEQAFERYAEILGAARELGMTRWSRCIISRGRTGPPAPGAGCGKNCLRGSSASVSAVRADWRRWWISA